ncbi:WYL domain-containing protein [Streptomyces sp. NBC_01136]|uniref:helix-turn-helix transcriptional regulator n=1 Tax=Streptomyces sp. NBC_01136 TaxID=2903754 RepID=UPI00386CE914|nr:WYL domain-containing protein [Streptomyces sp. NBC_01136]
MKADRLVATLLLLQARGRVTVREVAKELEVSERTARRDLEALTTAGVPVYSQRGRGGGWSLVGGARTDLTGFTSREIGALFLAAGPLSASPELRAALRKLMRAVPAPMRPHAEAASKAILIDGVDWSRTAGGSGPHQHALERAVLDGEQIRLGYTPPGRAPGERTVHPLGLVSKAGRWYLVAGTEEEEGGGGGQGEKRGERQGEREGLRTFRLSRVTSVERTGEPVRRPEGFDLASAWRELAAEVEQRLSAATVRARADRDALPVLRQLLGGRLRTGEVQCDGRVEFTADGPSVEILAAQLAGLGGRIEVLDPPEARESLVRLGESLTAVYGASGEERTPGSRLDSHFPLGTYYAEDASVPVMAATHG